MALIALDINAIREYSLHEDVEEEKTVFELGLLDAPLRAWIDDQAATFSLNAKDDNAPADVKWNKAKRDIELVRFGLRGWKNFKDAKGNDVKFDRTPIHVPNCGSRQGLSDVCFKYLKPSWIEELAKEILGDNHLDGEAEKN